MRIIVLLLVLSFSGLVAFGASPFLSEGQEPALLGLVSVFLGLLGGQWIGRKLHRPRDSAALAIGGILLLFCAFYLGTLSGSVALVLLGLNAIVTAASFITRSLGSGILALLSLVAFLVTAERVLDGVPENHLVKAVTAPPPLYPGDWNRGNETYQKMGFRGKRPCVSSCPDNLTRMVFIGGSSVAGVPMINAGFAYPAVVQRMLNEERPGENYEVLNAGIAGYGIMQIVDSLKQEILKLKPDIVVISSWFNDHSTMLNWYGVHGKSDRDAFVFVKTMQRIAAVPGFMKIYRSRLVGVYRHYLGQLMRIGSWLSLSDSKASKPIPRMNQEEFDWALEQIAVLAKEHNFLPVFLYEPTSHTESIERSVEKHPYYGVIRRFAERHEFPIIDTLAPFAARSSYGLFLDFIHPNRLGHEIMARAVMNGFFRSDGGGILQRFVGPVTAQSPSLTRSAEILLRGDSPVTVKVRAPHATYSQLLYAKGERGTPTVLGEIGREWSSFSVLNPEVTRHPLTRVFLTTRISGSTKLGPVTIPAALFVELESGGRESPRALININGVSFGENKRGFHVVVLDSESGIVLAQWSIDHFGSGDGATKVLSALRETTKFPRGSPVLIVTHTDGVQGIDARGLSDTLRILGGSGELPHPFEAFVFVGSVGAPLNTALEKRGAGTLRATFGAQSDRDRGAIELAP